MKKALKIIGFGVAIIEAFTFGILGGYELAWHELFIRKHYDASETLENVARDEWKKTPEFIFHCWTDTLKSEIRH